MKVLEIQTHTFATLTTRLIAIIVFSVLLSAIPFHKVFAETVPDLGFAVLGGITVTCTRELNSSGAEDLEKPLECIERFYNRNEVLSQNGDTNYIKIRKLSHRSVPRASGQRQLLR
jgi:hypothetical protein